jgi:hypothetical protein
MGTLRTRIVIGLALSLVFLPLSGANGWVLCIESGGRVTLEVDRGNDSCHSPELPSDCQGVADHDREACCSDLAIHQPASDDTQPRPRLPAAALVAYFSPLLSVAEQPRCPMPASASDPPTLALRRTIVLLV